MSLDANITKQSANVGLKQSSLEALGYVCEEVPDSLQSSSNLILTAIATGMDSAETNVDIKLAATTCLVNAIDFIKTNMATDADREMIMKMVFSVTSSPDMQVRVQAYQCIVQIASSYYKYLSAYMGTIFTLTTAAIQKEADDVALQAIEFWSTVADVEKECLEEDEENAETPSYQSRSHNFITAAVPHFAPVLLQALTKQHEDPDDDEWGTSLAAGTCLGLCAQVARDAIVPIVLPFIQQYVQDPNWRMREAAILAFGAILDGPNKTDLAKVVQSAFALLLNQMKDPHPLVKDTTAWTVGRICSILPEVIDPTTLPLLMQSLIHGLTESPKVASNVCWAIHNLASAVDVDDENPNTSALSAYFQHVVQALLQASIRPDVKDCNLQVSIYEALNIMVQSAAPDVHGLVGAVMPLIMDRLSQTLQERADSAESREALNEIQALLCGSLQAIVTKLTVESILPQADRLMTLFLTVLKSHNATVHEEALMAIGAVADKVGPSFNKYMDAIKEPLFQGLMNAQEYHVCDVAVHVTCDVTRAVGPDFQPWGDEVMKILLGHLQNPSIERTVKSHIIACMGDIALAVAGHFDRYMSYVMPMLTQASQTIFKADDWDNIDYMESLRESIIEAYSGILLGLSADNKVQVFVQQPNLLQSIVQLFEVIAHDENVTERVLRGAAGLILDLVRTIGGPIAQQLKRPAIEKILTQAQHEDCEPETRKNAIEAKQVRHTHTHNPHGHTASIRTHTSMVLFPDDQSFN